MNLGQVDAKDSMQGGSRIEGWRIGRFVAMPRRRQLAHGFDSWVSQAAQDRLDPQIALRDLGMVGVIKLQCLSEGKDVLLTPVSGQCVTDLLFLRMAAPITMSGQHGRISFTRNNGANDAHPGSARQVGHHMMELDIHLHQCLLHMLNVRRTVVQSTAKKAFFNR